MGRRVWALLVGLVALWLAAPAWAQQWTAAPEPEPVELPAVPADWVSVPGTWLVVHGDESHTGLMTQVARQGSVALPELAERLGVPIGTTVHVYLAEDDAEFRALQPGVPPAWADATAWPTLGAVFLRTPGARGPTDAPLEQVLEHELVHILLGRAFAPEAPPHWLQEGVARTLAGEVGPEDGRILQQSAIVGGPMTLRSLERGFQAMPTQVLEHSAWMRSDHDGLWYPEVKVGDTVKAGQNLGHVTDFLGNTVQTAVASMDGIVLFVVSTLAMNAGDPLLSIGA